MNNASALLDALWPAALNLSLGVTQAQLSRHALTVPDFWTSMSHSTIRTQHGVQPFVPFDWQQRWVEGVTPREMILKSRDVGSSEICVRYFCWRQLREGGNILIKADRHDNAKNLVAIARHYLQSLPDGERPNLVKDNETELELEGVGTIKAMAQGGGRSERCRYLLKTERAFWENPAAEEAAISGALVAGGWLIQESTAHGFNDWHADWVDQGSGCRKTFVGRDDNPTHDADWWARKQEELAEQGRTVQQEFPATPAEAFVATGNCLFEVERIQEYQAACREPLETKLNGALRIWRRPIPVGVYVAGADVAEGINAGGDRLDYSGVAVYEWRTCVHVADLHGRWPVDVFAKLAGDLAKAYNNALLGVERNNHGHAVLLALKQLEYPNIYQHAEIVDTLRGCATPERRRIAGWPTSVKTKPVMEQELAAAITSGSIVSYDSAFWDECLSYVQHGDGRTGAQAGAHDDRVVKHMIALQMRHHVNSGAAPPLSVAARWTG